MDSIGLWQIAENGPMRLQAAEVAVERDLEDWIERDPALLERGLVIIGRQIRLEGGPLDLLALDPQGRWVLIEIKRERLRREVIAQAIDYASCLDRLEPRELREHCDGYLRARGRTDTLDGLMEQRGRSLDSETDGREVVIYLVGTGYDPGFARMVSYLAEQAEMAIRVVTFSPFRDAGGRVLLAREIHESDEEAAPAATRPSGSAPTAEAILAMGEQNGVGAVMRTMHAAATNAGLYVRPWYKSIMYTPPGAKKRCLFTVWADGHPQTPGVARAYIAPEAFEQFYGIKEADLTAALGIGPVNGWVMLDPAKATKAAAGIGTLIGKAAQG